MAKTRTLLVLLLAACGGGEKPIEMPQAEVTLRQRLETMSLTAVEGPPPDPTNKYVDDPAAAVLGKKLFFDTRFSGPLLDSANNGQPGTLGKVGEAGKVACASCHVPSGSFSDTRSSRGQISLGAAWSHRRAPSLLDVAHRRFFNWDGSRDSAFSQVFTPIEDAGEFNSSRLFVAQQLARLYAAEYEAIFGKLPDLSAYAPVAPSDAGCNVIPEGVVHGFCDKPGRDDPEVTRVVVNMGKAIQAYTRQLSCGPGRFDAWLAGDDAALSAEEQAGAALFAGKAGCVQCHDGPHLTDDYFHNVGMAPNFAFFVVPIPDNGASDGIAALRKDPLSSKGPYADGTDDRQGVLPQDTSALVGAFKTPSLRCVSRRPSFMRTGQFRSLEDVVLFFARGGNPSGYPGVSENRPRDLSSEERAQLVAFLRALDGTGPEPSLVEPPVLPP
jgi:cytochrome c peroxidase